MTNYKIIASDIDCTLLNSNLTISSENMLAIKELAACGIHFVPASGRTLSEMPAKLRDNQYIRYIIHSNGAAVYDKATGKSILMCIPNDLSVFITELLKAYDVHITVRYGGRSYVDVNQQGEERYIHYNVCSNHREVVENYAIYSDDLYELLQSMDNIEMFALFFHDEKEKKECRLRLEEIDELLVVEAYKNNLEIFSKDAGKGNALKKLAATLNISDSDTVSVGDSPNDISMIKAAGLGLAVSNACDEVKEVADEIICSNDEHAILYIQKHILNI